MQVSKAADEYHEEKEVLSAGLVLDPELNDLDGLDHLGLV
jgi:hypothetical protein